MSDHIPSNPNERLSADDAHDWKKCEQLDRIYRQAYDDFAGPDGRRHAVNFDTYRRAGLIAVWNAALDAARATPETAAVPAWEMEVSLVASRLRCQGGVSFITKEEAAAMLDALVFGPGRGPPLKANEEQK